MHVALIRTKRHAHAKARLFDIKENLYPSCGAKKFVCIDGSHAFGRYGPKVRFRLRLLRVGRRLSALRIVGSSFLYYSFSFLNQDGFYNSGLFF